jgi:hypothetical protein
VFLANHTNGSVAEVALFQTFLQKLVLMRKIIKRFSLATNIDPL